MVTAPLQQTTDLSSFYEWRVPSQTAKTLGLLTAGLLLVSVVPVQILVRLATLMGGLTFFALFPIASQFPEYRLLVSPVKWMFWNIPTHAEWAIISLQAEGKSHSDQTASPQSSTKSETITPDHMGYRGTPSTAHEAHLSPHVVNSESETKIYGSYDCSYDHKPGKLILNSRGVKFVSSIGHKQEFTLKYENIEKLEKVVRIVSKGLGKNSGEDLKIVGPSESEFLLKNMKDRDQAFSQIVGFSSVRWQVVW